jgi:hypothetical protein
MEGMRRLVLIVGSIASAMVLACVAILLEAAPGVGKPRTVTLVGAGDIARCGVAADRATANLVREIPGTVFTLGDNVYPDGASAHFRDCYGPTWGKFKGRTKPTLGNHDYHNSTARPYFDYFGAKAGPRGRGYYSYDRGSWHIVALNSNCAKVGGCGFRSRQGRWLRRNLAKHRARCTLAYFHHPLFSSGEHGNEPAMRPIWRILFRANADVVVNGHDHDYERFAPQGPSGARRLKRGIREFVVGTGGAEHRPFDAIKPHSRARNAHTSGVLKLRLSSGSYHWRFVPIAGRSYTDSGEDRCH